MTTKTVQVNSLSIAYRESSGQGPAVLFVHGNSASSRIFQPQLESPLGEKYRLVAIDLPGHGESSKASDPTTAYNLPGYAAVVVSVIRQLGLEQAVFVGWSLGGHVLIEAMPQLSQASGYMIYGTPPLAFPPDMAQAFLPNPAMSVSFQAALTDAEVEGFAAACFKPDAADIPQLFKEDIRRTDEQTRASLAASIRPGGYLDEVVAISQVMVPLAIVHGEQEQLVNAAYIQSLTVPTLWRGAIQMIANAGHTPNWEQPAQFNALLEAFICDLPPAASQVT